MISLRDKRKYINKGRQTVMQAQVRKYFKFGYYTISSNSFIHNKILTIPPISPIDPSNPTNPWRPLKKS